MAKKPGEPSGRANKIKFVLLEADISDNNLSELTQAITSALRPGAVQIRQIGSGNGNNAPALPSTNITDAEIVDDHGADDQESEPAAPKAPRIKKFTPPQYLPELFADKAKEKAFKEFAAEKAPKSKSQRYLVAAYWLKEHAGSPTVNANKIYTSFKTAGWPSGFNDWAQPFHNLVHAEHMRNEGSGEFAINPLGEGIVNGQAE